MVGGRVRDGGVEVVVVAGGWWLVAGGLDSGLILTVSRQPCTYGYAVDLIKVRDARCDCQQGARSAHQ